MTPRPYLSYSQMTMLERSPATYRRVYIEGEKGFSNGAMEFGSQIGKLLEDNELSGHLSDDFVISQIPRLDIPEKEIFATLKNGNRPVPLIAKPDSVKVDLSALLEYKTGRNAWTQPKVDKHDQLTFYATVIWLLTKRIPELTLVWAETELQDGKTLFTGRVKTFKTQRHMGEIMSIMKRQRDAWELIQKMTHEALV